MIISERTLLQATKDVAQECVHLHEVITAAKDKLKDWPPKTPETVTIYHDTFKAIQIANDRFQVSLRVLTSGLDLDVYDKPADYSKKPKRRKPPPGVGPHPPGLLAPGEYNICSTLQSCLTALDEIRETHELCLKAMEQPKTSPLNPAAMPGNPYHIALWNILETNRKFLTTLNGIVDSCKWYLSAPVSVSFSAKTLKLGNLLARLKLVKKSAQARRPYLYRPFKFVRTTNRAKQLPVPRMAKNSQNRDHKIFRKVSVFCLGVTEMVASGLTVFSARNNLVKWLGSSGGSEEDLDDEGQPKSSSSTSSRCNSPSPSICNRPRISSQGIYIGKSFASTAR